MWPNPTIPLTTWDDLLFLRAFDWSKLWWRIFLPEKEIRGNSLPLCEVIKIWGVPSATGFSVWERQTSHSGAGQDTVQLSWTLGASWCKGFPRVWLCYPFWGVIPFGFMSQEAHCENWAASLATREIPSSLPILGKFAPAPLWTPKSVDVQIPRRMRNSICM